MNIQYNTISNWVNVAKGGHNCQFCGRTFPWKAALERHIVKQHKNGEGDGLKSRDIEAGSSKTTEMTGPLKAWHAEFLQTLMAEYIGEKLTKILEFVKTLPEEVVDKFAKEGGHKEIFEAEFHFEQDESGVRF